MSADAPIARDAAAYDRIARWYDVDMGRSMAFDDVGFYVGLATRAGARVLELGCGTGRVYLPMVAAGVDAVGIDRSAGMLAELRAAADAQRLAARVARMDMRALGLRPGYGLVLCPYSLVTYLTLDGEVDDLCRAVRALLVQGGAFVLDAFVPRASVASGEFREDYRRALPEGTLVRSKRVTVLGGGVHRIERRYAVHDPAGRVIDAAATEERLRPCTPATLVAHLERTGFEVEQTWWDYGTAGDAATAQFATLLARPAQRRS